MDKMQSKKTPKIKGKLIALAILVVLLVTLLVLKSNTAVAEWFTDNISRNYITVASVLFGWIPFSMYELFLIVAIVLVIVAIVVIIVRLAKKRYLASLSLLLVVSISGVSFATLYTAVAGMSYNRSELDIPLYSVEQDGQVEYNTILNFAEQYINTLNLLASSLDRNSDSTINYPSCAEMSKQLNQLYDSLAINGISNNYVHVKQITNSWIMSQMRIAGVFFAPFGEANINRYIDSYTLPQTMAHEMAHGKGVMRETDAVTLSKYVLLLSDIDYFKYSAMVSSVGSVLQMISLYPNSNDDYIRLNSMISKTVSADIKYNTELWAKYTLLGDIGKFFNDLYLKLSGVQEGTGSYNPPPIYEDTGEVDDDGEEIVIIVSFSPAQNMLLQLYLDGHLA